MPINFFVEEVSFSLGDIEADIFVSIERVKENAKTLKISEENELSRVLSHGLFHLLGYKDKTKQEVLLMRTKEEYAISLFDNI